MGLLDKWKRDIALQKINSKIAAITECINSSRILIDGSECDVERLKRLNAALVFSKEIISTKGEPVNPCLSSAPDFQFKLKGDRIVYDVE